MALGKGQGFEGFATATALGSLALLGIFLIVDGQVDILVIIERYGRTTTWTLIAALPLVVLTYLLGLFVELASAALLPRVAAFVTTRNFGLAEADDFLVVAALGNDAVMQRYASLIKDRQLLDGSSIPLFLLSMGAFSEKARLVRELGRDMDSVVTLIGLVALIAAGVAPIAGYFKGRSARTFAESASAQIPARLPPAP